MLVEIADGEVYTIDAIMGKFNGEYGFHIGNELAAQVRDLLFDVSQMPVNIFEAKPERAVGFDEVLAAVLPDDASGELRDALSGRGVKCPYLQKPETTRTALPRSMALRGREQMKDYIAIQRRNGKLQESRDYWQGQTRRTRRVTTDKKAVSPPPETAYPELRGRHRGEGHQETSRASMTTFASGYDGKDELTYTEARRRAEAIAMKAGGQRCGRGRDLRAVQRPAGVSAVHHPVPL